MSKYPQNTCSKDWKKNKRMYEECMGEDSFNYDKFYNGLNYCTPAFHLKLHNYYDLCMQYLKKGDKWLDVGCGCGYILSNSIKDGIEPYGIEIVDKSVKLAKQRNIKAVKCSACETYPFADEYFDFITSIDVLEHLLKEDVSRALKEIYRVLKHGKYLLLASCTGDPNNLRPETDWKRYYHLTYQSIGDWVKTYEEHNFVFVKQNKPYGVFLKKL